MGAIIGSIFGGGLVGIFGWQHLNADEIVKNLDGTFNNLNKIIQGAVDLVTKPIDSLIGIWSVISSVNSAILPIGYSLLTLFFLLGLINRSMSFRIIRIEDIIRLLIRLVIAKAVMERSFDIMNMIYNMSMEAIFSVDISVESIKIVDTVALAEQISEMNLIERILFQSQFTPISIVCFILNIMVFVICYGRIIELCVYTALSPIPIAALSSEDYAGSTKRFFQHYVAICLQGLIIVLVGMLFGGLAKTLLTNVGENADFGIGTSIAFSIMLILVLSKSEAWAGKITGVS